MRAAAETKVLDFWRDVCPTTCSLCGTKRRGRDDASNGAGVTVPIRVATLSGKPSASSGCATVRIGGSVESIGHVRRACASGVDGRPGASTCRRPRRALLSQQHRLWTIAVGSAGCWSWWEDPRGEREGRRRFLLLLCCYAIAEPHLADPHKPSKTSQFRLVMNTAHAS